jgi:hypothetical protein
MSHLQSSFNTQTILNHLPENKHSTINSFANTLQKFILKHAATMSAPAITDPRNTDTAIRGLVVDILLHSSCLFVLATLLRPHCRITSMLVLLFAALWLVTAATLWTLWTLWERFEPRADAVYTWMSCFLALSYLGLAVVFLVCENTGAVIMMMSVPLLVGVVIGQHLTRGGLLI